MATISQRLAVSANYSSTRTLPEMWKIRSCDPAPERIGKLALIDIPARSAAVRHLINFVATREFTGYESLGGGAEQIVLANGKRVLKLVIQTQSEDLSSLERAAERLQKDSDRCHEFLGDSWVNTDFGVTRMPKSDMSVITAVQPRINALRYYKSVGEMVEDNEVLSASCVELGEAIDELYSTSGLLPDLLGRNNIARVQKASGKSPLRIVDTIAVTPQKQDLAFRQSGITIGERMQQEVALLVSA